MSVEQALVSPTFPIPAGTLPITGATAAPGRRLLLRKTVDYHATCIRHLENRLWQRDSRDQPFIQPDLSYYNTIDVPQGCSSTKVNIVTTKFVKACTNKTRSPIFSATWVPDGRRLITGAANGEFTLWNGINFNFESIIQAHDCSVRSMTWSHNGKWLVTSDDRGFIKYWQINFNNVHTFQAHSEPVRSSSFSPTDTKLATCSDDGTVRIYDFLCCTEEHILRGHGADVKCVHWHPCKCLLASGSKDNQQPVKLWDPKSGQSICTIHAHKATVMDIKWNINGNWLATASRDYLIKLYDIRVMKEFAVLKGHKKDVNTLSWHPVYEEVFCSGGSDGAVLFWMVGNDREIGGMESAHEGFVWTLAWHPLGHLLCSGANDHTCKFWSRNRPGEELKDKYNSYQNPFFLGDELDVNMPGMGVMDHMRGPMMAPPTDSITLPPPPSSMPWRQPLNNEMPSNLQAPRVDIPVLGADIIAETFSGKDSHQNISENETPNKPLSADGPANIRPLLDGPPPPRGYHGDPGQDWDRPGNFGGPHPPHDEFGGNRFTWHRADYQGPRRPSVDDDRWNHSNPFIYRRGDHGGPPMGHPPPPRRPSEDFNYHHDESYRRMDYRPPADRSFGGGRPYGGPHPPGDHPYGGDRPFNERPRDGHFPGDRQFSGGPPPPPGDRQYNGPPPPGDRQFTGPPPSGDRQYNGPPPPGDRQYNGPLPPRDRQFSGPPPPGDRQYSGPPGERQFNGPPPPGDRPFSGPPPPGERQFSGPPPGDRQFGSHPPPGDRQFSGPHTRERQFGGPGDRQFEGPPPSGDRQYAGPSPQGIRQYGGPPPPGDRQYGGPPPSGDRQYGGPPPSGDRQYGGPPPEDRQYVGPPQPGDRQFGGPPPQGDRQFGRPPPDDRKFNRPPPTDKVDPPPPGRREEQSGYNERQFPGGPPPSYHPQDPRQAPPEHWRPHEKEGKYPLQDPRQQQPAYQGGSGDPRYHTQPAYPVEYSKYDDRESGYHGHDPPNKMDGPPARDPRSERRGGGSSSGSWRDNERRRDDFDDKRRDDGRGRGRDNETRRRDRDPPETKRPKRDSSDVNRSSASSRDYSGKKK